MSAQWIWVAILRVRVTFFFNLMSTSTQNWKRFFIFTKYDVNWFQSGSCETNVCILTLFTHLQLHGKSTPLLRLTKRVHDFFFILCMQKNLHWMNRKWILIEARDFLLLLYNEYKMIFLGTSLEECVLNFYEF